MQKPLKPGIKTMARETILIIDDEEDILELVRYNLAREGYNIRMATSGEQALRMIRQELPDLVLLDLMLPNIDGLEVCKRMKSDPDTAGVPVVMLTAKGAEADIVAGLELGATDYITKPFSPRILTARVKAVLRRNSLDTPDSDEVISIHDLVIHPGRHEVTYKGQPLDLTHTEFKVLQYLARRPGWVFTRYQIVDAVHGVDHAVTERSVDVQIVGLRKKLGDAGEYIETVRGVGYRFRE